MQYWVVGAMWGGKDDVLPQFIKRGYWYCWDTNTTAPDNNEQRNSISVQQQRFRKIEPGDRIAVKKMLGRGSAEMSILAISVVKDVDVSEWRAYVNWVEIGPSKEKCCYMAAQHQCTPIREHRPMGAPSLSHLIGA